MDGMQLAFHLGYATRAQAAVLLGTSVETIRQHTNHGDLEVHRLDGRCTLYALADLADLRLHRFPGHRRFVWPPEQGQA